MSIPRTAIWAVRRIADRRAEQRVNRVLQAASIRTAGVPDELARNQADRTPFFALVGDWRSELS